MLAAVNSALVHALLRQPSERRQSDLIDGCLGSRHVRPEDPCWIVVAKRRRVCDDL
jgi:hypothetical protein